MRDKITGPQEDAPRKPIKGMLIIGANLLILVAYTIFSKMQSPLLDAVIANAFFIAFHVVVCLIAALVARKWVWVLSAVLVLLIGFSTCSKVPPMKYVGALIFLN